MATIESRITDDGKKAYRVKIRLKGYPPQTATFERLTDARKWAQSTESAIREGRHFKTAESKRRTLADTIIRYRNTRTIDVDKTRHLDWWQERIGAYALADVTASLIAECREELANGEYKRRGQRKPAPRTHSTCNRYLTSLSHVLSTAVREFEWLDANPCGKVKKLKEPRGRVRFLSDDERTRLLTACQESTSPYLYILVVLALSTGARYMELLGMRWSQIDLKRGLIRLEKTKNGERRSLPLKGHALELVQAHARLRRLDTDLVFPSGRDPSHPVHIRSAFEAAVDRAGIEDFHFHDLRHSCASYLAMNGASLAEISEVLGHKTLAMVKRYAHLSDDHVAGVVAKMNAAIFGD